MRFSDIITFFTDTVFRKSAGDFRNPVARWAVRQYKLLFYTVQGLSSHGTMVRSAALTFYTLMSLVPVVALVFAVVKGFGLADGLEQNLYEVLPQSPEVIDYVVDFAQKALARTQGGWVALVGVLTLFWAVIKVFGSIEDAFNNIWEVKGTRSAARKYSDYIAVVVIAPILWVVSSSFGNYAAEILGVAGSPALEVLSRAASLAVTWVMFTFIYVVLPGTKVRLTSALTAGIVAGTVFLLFQWGYVYLQRWMTSYNAIYGSFAALPLFLLWMQISWEILLLGGELSFAYQNAARFDEERESLLVSYDCRRKLMVGVVVLVARAFRDGRGAVSFSEIRDRLDVPTRIMNNILFTLVQARMLNEIRTEGTEYDLEYAPARDISQLRVYDVLEAVDSHGFGRDTIDMRTNRELRRGAEAVERLKAVTRASDRNVRIVDLMDGADALIRSGGNWVAFFTRLNIIAWFRFVFLVFREVCIRAGISFPMQKQLDAYICINQVLKAYLEQLKQIDFERFQKESTKYKQVIVGMEKAVTEEELNAVLKNEYAALGLKLPYGGDFDAFMKDKTVTLTFE